MSALMRTSPRRRYALPLCTLVAGSVASILFVTTNPALPGIGPPPKVCKLLATAHAGPNKNFFTDGVIDGHPVSGMIDTGDAVTTIPKELADKFGYRKLVWDQPVTTANGRTKAARIVLKSITIGDLTLTNFPAEVSRRLDNVLIGMDVMSRYSVHAENDILTIREKC
jgi:clan AA aspartic protease (TIGR02281 family)